MASRHQNQFETRIIQELRPRERLQELGGAALSEQELLAIVLRTGAKECDVLTLGGELLNKFGNLYELKQASTSELEKIKGIGPIKALELVATFELSRRVNRSRQIKLGTVTSSASIAGFMIEELRDSVQEQLIGIYLNTKNQIIKKVLLFQGSLNQSIAHPRDIYHHAVKCSAARIILVHNHPSGDCRPSANDLEFTKRVVKCGELMGIEILDHLIVGCDTYRSLKEDGVI